MYNQRLAVLSSFYTFVQETYKLQIPNPVKDVKRRKVQYYRSAETIPPEEVELGLDSIDRSTKEGVRDYALLAVALRTGRRASEIAGMYGRDVKIQGRSKDVRIRIVFHCKGDKETNGRAIGIRTLSNIVASHLPTSKVHALRHTFTVGMLRSGAPLTDVADHLGHTDIKITRLYAKELTGDENKYGEQLEKRFGIKRKAK